MKQRMRAGKNKGFSLRYSIFDIRYSAVRFFKICLTALMCLLVFAGCGERGGEPEAVVIVEDRQETVLIEGAPVAREAEPVAEKTEPKSVAEDAESGAEKAEPDIPVVPRYTVTYTAGDSGFIDGDGTQAVARGGDSRAVAAVAKEGYHFVRWSDGSTANPRLDDDVNAEIAVTAIFAVNQYTLAYTAQGNGSIDGASPQTVAHGADGRPVTAVPAGNHHFTGWSDGVATTGRTDRNVKADVAVTANFAVDQYTLTYLAADNGSIEGPGSQKVDHGGAGSAVTAVPAAGYHFAGWSDEVETASRTDRNVTADLKVTADFAVNRYPVTYTAGEHGAITGASSQMVDHGSDSSEVTAVADKGYHFTGWSDGVETARRVDREVAGDLAVSASFAVNTYRVGGSISGLVKGTEVLLRNNGGDDLRLTANGGFDFATALLDGATYQVTVLTQPARPNQTCTVVGGSGTIADADATDILVTCVLDTYTIGGTVSGLPAGDRVVLRNKGGDDLAVSADGSFAFALALDDHSDYEVTILSQITRPNWNCTVDNGAGTLAGRAVSDIQVTCFVEAVLQTTAGINKVELSWNSHDFSGATFNLCRARNDISPSGFSECRNLKGGVLDTGVSSSHAVARLLNDVQYWFQLEVRHAGGQQTYSKIVAAIPFGGLNDTGIDWCSDINTNRFMDGTRSEKSESCDTFETTHPRQDGHEGRDAAARNRRLAKIGSGSAGFDFTKVCMSGEAAGKGKCPPNPILGNGPNNWACTRDNVTGLMWEIKNESGLRSASNTYTWYNPAGKTNGGEPGLRNGGTCPDGSCDTHAYVRAVNGVGLCGATDWRLPTRKELLSIVDNGRFDPALDPGFFPDTSSGNYWSSSPYADQANSAWQVYFQYGEAYPVDKKQENHVRLVRGRTVTFGFDNP
jgi:hypothetical protein